MHTGSPFDTSSFTFCLWVGISVGDTERGQRALRCLFGLLGISSLHPCACFTTIQFQESEAILSCGQVAPLTTQKPHKHRTECFKHAHARWRQWLLTCWTYNCAIERFSLLQISNSKISLLCDCVGKAEIFVVYGIDDEYEFWLLHRSLLFHTNTRTRTNEYLPHT